MNIEKLTDYFWTEETMTGEPLFFIQKSPQSQPCARLLFIPEKVISVQSATLETQYIDGKDYVVDHENGIISLPPGSRIPFKTIKEMYPPADIPGLPDYIRKRGAPDTALLFGEAALFHRLQVLVDYTHPSDEWQGSVPSFAGYQLPNTMAKLKQKKPLVLCVSGDSISAGANSSGLMDCPPHQPEYARLVADGIAHRYNSQVSLRNFAVGGWSSGQGRADIVRLAAEKPDLVIVAFGMNDNLSTDVKDFIANIKAIMKAVRDSSSETEFILVASMTGNPEWAPIRPEQFKIYRDELAKLTGHGVALADLTSMWDALLKRKSFHDLTGNGVNHPNDFGHRVYAQTIMALLV